MKFKGPNHSVMLTTGIQSSEHSSNMAKLGCVANSTKMQHTVNTMTANSCVQQDNSTQHFLPVIQIQRNAIHNVELPSFSVYLFPFIYNVPHILRQT